MVTMYAFVSRMVIENLMNGKLAVLRALVSQSWKEARRDKCCRVCTIVWLFYYLSFGRFSPSELQSYAPQLLRYRRNMPVVISKEKTIQKLEKHNLRSDANLTEDKLRFYRFCEERQIPCPKMLFSTAASDEKFQQLRSMANESRPESFLNSFPEEFIVKPRRGAYGKGFMAFKKEGLNFLSNSGEKYSPGALIDFLGSDTHGELICQLRIFDHPELEALSEAKAIQSLRINSFRDQDGNVKVEYFVLKVLRQGNIIDNFERGANGNMLAFGNMETGVLAEALTTYPDRIGLYPVLVHPDTGLEFSGFKVPLWDQSIELVKRTHRQFENLASIGWDVAITADGPLILEGNAWWDPPLHAPWILPEVEWRRLLG